MSQWDDGVRGDRSTGNGHVGRDGREDDWGTENWESAALPTDLAAVQADDALVDALHSSSVPDDGSDAALAQVLVAWRDEVNAEPVKTLVDTDTALAMVARGRRSAPRRRPVLVPFAAAAAALVIAFSGVGLGAKAAEPGDRLWSVTKVLYTEHARSVEAAVVVRTQLEEASTALREGRAGDAQTILQRVEQELAVVAEPEGRAELEAQHNSLQGRLGDKAAEPKPEAPLPGSSSTMRTPVQESDPSAQPVVPPPAADTADEPSDPPPDTSTEPEAPSPSTPPQPETGTGDTGPGSADGGEAADPTPRSSESGGSESGGSGSAAPESAPTG